ncbi:MAG: hypothetical protein ACTHM6_03830 [Tepidisphaeraceae bacterium]
MIKKLLSVIIGVLALNFLAAAGGVGYLVFTKKLDRAKVHEIRDLILDKPKPATQPATQPAVQESPANAPMLRLDALIAKAAGRTAPEQVKITQTALQSEAATLERRLQELDAQRQEIELARAQLQKDRQSVQEKADKLKAQQAQEAKLATDEGFQNSLALYAAMAPKRVKQIFATMDDDVVVRYLQAMDPRQAASVLKEFKTPDETNRAKTLLEKIRQAQAKVD